MEDALMRDRVGTLTSKSNANNLNVKPPTLSLVTRGERCSLSPKQMRCLRAPN